MEESNRIEGEVRLTKVLFSAIDSDYKILGVEPVNITIGEELITLSEYNNFVIKGNAPNGMNFVDSYKVILEKGEEDKYGEQYNIVYIGKPMKLTDDASQRLFLESFLTEKQCKSLYKTLDSPFKAIEEGDVKALMSCDGIGAKRAQKILEKYEESKDYSGAYVALFEYGLTNNMIKKLVDRYNSPDLAVEKVKENPYILATEVDGVGFKRADEIALATGVGELSVERMEAFMLSFLTEQAHMGFSWLSPSVLFGNLTKILELDPQLKEVQDAIRAGLYSLKSQDKVWYDDSKTRIALTSVRNIEKEIAKNLIRLKNAENTFNFKHWEDAIARTEKQQGWNFTEQQIDGIETVLKHNVVMVTGYGGCVDKDTEYFNGREWKPISEYVVGSGERVLQFNKDRTASLVEPERYVKYPEREFIEIKTERGGIDQRLSWEHNVVYETSKGNLIKKPLADILARHKKSKFGFTGKFLTTFDYEGEGIPLTNEEIRLMVAVIGDGSFPRETNYCTINISKQRKTERIESLLKEANVEYTKSFTSGMTRFNFQAPLRLKEYPKEWYKATREQFKIITDEVLHWGDSVSNGRDRFSSTSKQTMDFIQFAFATIGRRATISTRDRVGEDSGQDYQRQSVEYEMHITKRSPKVSITPKDPRKKLPMNTVASEDGYKYCFEVPSGMLVLRRNNRIFVTGNTGKTSIVSGMLDVLAGHDFIQGALSGKAGARLAEVTGEDGYTIHRMLEYSPADGFIRDERFPLDQEIVIIDELSMVGAGLFEKLVRAVKTGSKLIMLCDVGQLESIGLGNIAQDIIESGVIKVVNLTQIHRQAEKSAIVTTSLEIRKGTQTIRENGYEIRGELQDLELDIYPTKDSSFVKVIKHFEKELELADGKIEDVQVVVPMKNNGSISTFTLNNKIQEICNPKEEGFFIGEERDDEIEVSVNKNKKYYLRLGDKVINNKNNYSSLNIDGAETPIFNGDTGIVTEIDKVNEFITIDFVRVGLVLVPFRNIKDIELAYALTAHKMQGSEAKRVIVGLDYSAYMLLSKEWVYTAITRAKEHCVLIAELPALQQAIRTSNVSEKQTFLQEFLQEESEHKIES